MEEKVYLGKACCYGFVRKNDKADPEVVFFPFLGETRVPGLTLYMNEWNMEGRGGWGEFINFIMIAQKLEKYIQKKI